MAGKTYQEMLDEMLSANAESASMAVDYLDGDQLQHFTDYLDTDGAGIKKWRERGVLLLWENITGLIIDRSAQTYQQEPEREVINQDGSENEAGTEAYNKLLGDSNAGEVLEDADMLSRLLKTSVVIPQYSEDREGLYFSAVSQHNCGVDYDRASGQFRSIIYYGGGIGPNGGKLYHYWDTEKVVDIEIEGNGNAGTITKSEAHQYGIVPAAVLFDIRPPRYGFWSKPVWEQLIHFNNGINLYHTETKFNQRFQSLGQIVTNAEISDGQMFGPDVVVKLKATHPDEAIFYEYKAPSSISVAISSFGKWLDSYRENVGQEWGVNIKTAGEGSADSGFKLVVEELPGLQLRKKRQKPATTFEQDLYKVCLQLSRVHSLGLVENTKLKVTFPAPDLPVNLKEKAEIRTMRLANGEITLEDIWREDDPSLTDDDIQERKSARARTLPTFENQTEG